MSVVTEEMVGAATLAAINKRRAALKVPPIVSLVGLQIPGGSNALEIDAMRAALAAVAPMIARAEREQIAGSLVSAAAQVAGPSFLRGKSKSEHREAVIVANVMVRQAAAIRALGDAT